MKHLGDRLENLQEELRRNEEAIADQNETLAGAQEALKRLTAKKTALQRIVDDVKATKSGTEKQREAAEKERQDGEQVYDELLARLNKELSEDYRDAIEAAISAVDGEIEDLKQKVADLQRQVADAESALEDAKEHAAELDASFRATQTRLRQLPKQIQTTQGQVSKLKGAARTAADSGRATEAYLLLKELRQAIDELEALTDPQKEQELVDQLTSQWEQLNNTNNEVADNTSSLEQLKRDLATAEKELQPKVQGRQAAIKERLEAGAELEPGPTTPETGQPAATPVTSHVPRS